MITKEDIVGIRRSLGLNQARFGHLLGVHEITVSRWERGEFHPTVYQQSLMEEFRKAARDRQVKEALANLIIGAGIIAALYFLLGKSRGRH